MLTDQQACIYILSQVIWSFLIVQRAKFFFESSERKYEELAQKDGEERKERALKRLGL